MTTLPPNNSFTRTDTSVLGRWWWTVDRWSLSGLLALMTLGIVLMFAASPASVARIPGLENSFHFAQRHLVFLPVAVVLMVAVSLMEIRTIRRMAVIGLLGCFVFLCLTLFLGDETKGATRWISLFGFSLQPSEFLKPFFTVTTAWILAIGKSDDHFPGHRIAFVLYVVFTSLLVLQPDLGQTVLLSAMTFTQLFIAGLPWVYVIVFCGLGLVGLVTAYLTLPHVTARINGFLDRGSEDRYQIERSLEAFRNGGIMGQGPGEGTIKARLPDSHSDFIFAVAGEELGLIFCLVIIGLYAFIVIRSLARLMNETSLFVLLACSGLLAQFALQAMINIASTLSIIPTKGMTLPFLSYGGSSLLALGLGMGMVLAMTRRRFRFGEML